MKCPYCNEEMVKGYIQCRDGIDWTEKKQVILHRTNKHEPYVS